MVTPRSAVDPDPHREQEAARRLTDPKFVEAMEYVQGARLLEANPSASSALFGFDGQAAWVPG